jgi:hypothetical protein
MRSLIHKICFVEEDGKVFVHTHIPDENGELKLVKLEYHAGDIDPLLTMIFNKLEELIDRMNDES